MTEGNKNRAGKSRQRRVAAELNRRGFTLKEVGRRVGCTERYVHYVVSGSQPLTRRPEKGRKVLRVVRWMLARKPKARPLSLRDLVKLAKRRGRAA